MTDKYADLRAALNAGPTPGPWEARRNNAYWEVNPVNGAGDNGIPFTVADVCPSAPEDPDGGLQEANARMMAAAHPETITDLLAERDALAKDAEQLKELLEAANCCLEFSVADAFMRHKNQAGVCKEWAMLKRQLRAAMAGREGEG